VLRSRQPVHYDLPVRRPPEVHRSNSGEACSGMGINAAALLQRDASRRPLCSNLWGWRKGVEAKSVRSPRWL
jgi:hypothetical protein